MNGLRQRFWILNVRQTVKKVFYNCQKCKNKKSTPCVPLMGKLPQCRLERTVRPFIRTGVDYFGPIEVTVKRSHEKRYGVIFTCMATKAVHLEIANDLSTNGFIMFYDSLAVDEGFRKNFTRTAVRILKGVTWN